MTVISNLFPTTVFLRDCHDFQEKREGLIQAIYDYKNRHPKGKVRSNRGGWQSSGIDQTDENLGSYVPWIGQQVHAALTGVLAEQTVVCPDNIWLNINGKGHYNVIHSHPGSHYSGTLWVKVPDSDSEFFLENPSEFSVAAYQHCFTDEFRGQNGIGGEYHFQPEEGRMILFPSHIRHGVWENNSDADRISISFNFGLFADASRRR